MSSSLSSSCWSLVLLILTLVPLTTCVTISKPYNGSVYTGNQDKGSFQDTVNWCASLGGQLPSVHSQADIDFLTKDLGLYSVWLGAYVRAVHDSGSYDSYQWTDGSPVRPFVKQEAKAQCADCCGLILYNGSLAVAPLCNDDAMRQMACHLPNSAAEFPELKQKVDDLGQSLAERTSVDQQMYQKILNALLEQGHQVMIGTEVISQIQREFEAMADRLQELEDKMSNSSVPHNHTATMSHIHDLNQTVNHQIAKLNDSLTHSRSSFNFSLATQLEEMSELVKDTRRAFVERDAHLIHVMSEEIHQLKQRLFTLTLVFSLCVIAVTIFLAVRYHRQRRSDSAAEDHMRLNQMDDDQ